MVYGSVGTAGVTGLTRWRRSFEGWLSLAPALIVLVCALVSFACALGIVGSASDGLEALLPLDGTDSSPVLAAMSAVGFAALAVGIARNKALAWLLTLATLLVSLVTAGNPLGHPVVIAATVLAFVVLIRDRRRYEVQTGMGPRRFVALMAILGILTVGLQTAVVIIATGDWPGPLSFAGDLTSALANSLGLSNEAGERILRGGSRDALVGLLILVARLPVVLASIGILARVPEPLPDPSTRSRARAIAAQYGCGALLPFQLGEDKYVFDPSDLDGLLVYGLAGRTAVVLGDPIGPCECSTTLLRRFVEHSHRLDRTPVVYQASEAGLADLAAAGFRTFKIGQEAIVRLAGFDLSGSRRANLRHTITRCRRDGVTFRWYEAGLPPEEADVAAGIAAIDAQWQTRTGLKMGFSISCFDAGAVRRLPVAVATDRDGHVLGFATFRPTGTDGGWVLDLMRRDPAGPPGVVEGCIAEAATGLRASGAPSLSLGLAPLAGLEAGTGSLEERLLGRAASLVGDRYDVRGLAFFKGKFDPVWVPRYGAIRRRRDLVGFVVGLLRVHFSGAISRPRWGRVVQRPAVVGSEIAR